MLVRAVEDRRLVVVAGVEVGRPFAAVQQLRSLSLGRIDLRFDAGDLGHGGQGPHLGFLRQRIADVDLAGTAGALQGCGRARDIC